MNERTLVLCPSESLDGAEVRAFLEAFSALDAEPGLIKVLICSDGGWTNGAFAIYDAIVNANNPVVTVAMGTVGSAAVVIHQAGKLRLVGKNAVFFLHEGGTELHEKFSAMKRFLSEGERLDAQYRRLISERSGIPEEAVKKLCDGDSFVPAEDAINLGLADGYLEPGMKLVIAKKPKPKKKKVKK
jgi:ATP-dependent protease ClpP protease subunit